MHVKCRVTADHQTTLSTAKDSKVVPANMPYFIPSRLGDVPEFFLGVSDQPPSGYDLKLGTGETVPIRYAGLLKIEDIVHELLFRQLRNPQQEDPRQKLHANGSDNHGLDYLLEEALKLVSDPGARSKLVILQNRASELDDKTLAILLYEGQTQNIRVAQAQLGPRHEELNSLISTEIFNFDRKYRKESHRSAARKKITFKERFAQYGLFFYISFKFRLVGVVISTC